MAKKWEVRKEPPSKDGPDRGIGWAVKQAKKYGRLVRRKGWFERYKALAYDGKTNVLYVSDRFPSQKGDCGIKWDSDQLYKADSADLLGVDWESLDVDEPVGN